MAPFQKSIVEQVKTSKQHVSVLFTDISDSVEYFEKKGDVFGRLMVDNCNSIIFPVIKKFSGKVIKTIGDGVMASFKEPYKAINASIAIQQALDNERAINEDFDVHVKIGIHTGEALVEANDLYGDVVNVTARIQKTCNFDEIRFSEGTMEFLIEDTDKLVEKESVTLKGKAKPVLLFECKWKEYPYLLEGHSIDGSFPVVAKQKFEIIGYTIVSLGILFFLYLKYFRYLIVDSEYLAQYVLNPMSIVVDHTLIPVGIGCIVLAFLLILYQLQRVPYVFFQLLKGGFGFAIGLQLFFIPMTVLDLDFKKKWNEEIYSSKHFFVTIQDEDTNIHARSSFNTPVIQVVDKGSMYLFKEQRYRSGIRWNKVLIDQRTYGWVARNNMVLPNEAPQIVSKTNKFKFWYKDFYALLAGMVGFIWGFYNFRVRLS